MSSKHSGFWVYKITNTVNNKIYVGQTMFTLVRRMNEHVRKALNGDTSPLHKDMAKYGIENFTIEEIDFAENLEQLNYKEKFWAEYLNSYDENIGYNHDQCGHNRCHTQETKDKISKINSGKFSGENNPMYRKHHSEQSRKAMSDFAKINNKGENNPMYGKTQKESSKEKMKQRWKDNREKRIALHNKKCICVETRMIFDSQKSAAEYYSVSVSLVNASVAGLKTVHGYHIKNYEET